MQFKTDENLPEEAAALLVQAGYDAVTVLAQKMGGKSDPTLVEICRVEGRILVTLDLDFADIRLYPPASHAGIVVLRPATQAKVHLLVLLEKVVAKLGNEVVDKSLWIVDEAGIRIRSGGQ